jgi:hypothetical protein
LLVYGDHHELADPRQRLLEVDRELQAIGALPAGLARHAKLIGALIELGRVVQGVEDAAFAATGCDDRSSVTASLNTALFRVAQAACRSWDSGFSAIAALPRLELVEPLPDRVELRLPEGFAFYALYPEAHVDAARRLTLAAPARVIGIRSIGTALAAVVAAALGACVPVTVRPHDDPFARHIAIAPALERELLAGEAHFVIVDEGPGQSGSSFGAVAEWLEQRGVPLDRIAFLPSHGGDPGPQATSETRRRWNAAQRVPADFGERLPALLERWCADVLGPLDQPLEDISGGAWRRHRHSDERDWPAVVAAWERRKFLARAAGEEFLVKFAGLGAIGERKLATARALHAHGFTPEPVGLVHGFLVERWCSGAQPVARPPIAAVGKYIGTRARLFPAAADSGASFAELLAMCRRNISLALGDRMAKRLDHVSVPSEESCRRVRTDNRLDAHEWLRTRDGALLKTDALDHHQGHDLIGCPDVAWDVAGAACEYELDAGEIALLIESVEQALGRSLAPRLLDFYRIAYPAFRLGQAVLGTEMADDRADAARLRRSTSRYSDQIQRRLHCSSAPTRLDSLVD